MSVFVSICYFTSESMFESMCMYVRLNDGCVCVCACVCVRVRVRVLECMVYESVFVYYLHNKLSLSRVKCKCCIWRYTILYKSL